MTLKELLGTTSWEDVSAQLVRSYPSSEASLPGYKNVFETLLEMDPTKTSDMTILIERRKDLLKEESYFDVACGKIKGVKQTVALNITPWVEWLGMKIDSKALRDYTPDKLAALCLFEMTFHGFTEEKIHQFEMELDKSIHEKGREFLDISDLLDGS